MRHIALIAALVLLVLLGLAARAYGAERAKRPTVCLSYEIAKPGVAVCYDSKRPVLLTTFSEVTAQGPDGAVKMLVGWR